LEQGSSKPTKSLNQTPGPRMPLAEAGWGFFCFLAYAWPNPSFAVVRLGQRIGKLDLQTKLAGRAVGQCSQRKQFFLRYKYVLC